MNRKRKKKKDSKHSKMTGRTSSLHIAEDHLLGKFDAMTGPCEILMDTHDRELGEHLLEKGSREAWRIEKKLSRYRTDNIVHTINTSGGKPVKVDGETAQILDFAHECFELSDGLFDVTSGVLRRAWKFDGSDTLPAPEKVEALLPFVGWQKVIWEKPYITLPEGMEIDLGGIGKEYAVDKTLLELQGETGISILVNFGGDLCTNLARSGGGQWVVGIEKPVAPDGKGVGATRLINVNRGALATSGDTRRFILKNGKRYSHVLDPRKGWPVEHAPRTVTVAGETCTKAGILATLALLHGERAEEFLNGQGARYWIMR